MEEEKQATGVDTWQQSYQGDTHCRSYCPLCLPSPPTTTTRVGERNNENKGGLALTDDREYQGNTRIRILRKEGRKTKRKGKHSTRRNETKILVMKIMANERRYNLNEFDQKANE